MPQRWLVREFSPSVKPLKVERLDSSLLRGSRGRCRTVHRFGTVAPRNKDEHGRKGIEHGRMAVIKWEQSEQQRLFCETDAFEVLYGGKAGGGKSYVQCQDALIYGLTYPHSRQLILRRTFPELQKSIIRTTQEMYPREFAKYNAGAHMWTLCNGSVIDFGYCDSESDVYRYQSAEYDVIRFDELTHFTEDMYLYMISRVRGANGYPKHVKSSTNPGGVGHGFVKARFIDPGIQNKTFQAKNSTRIFIPANLKSNKWLMEKDPEYAVRLRNLPEDEYKKLGLGLWDINDGAYFSEWRRDLHVAEPFEIPKEWRRYFAMDYGLDMLAGYWIAVDGMGNAYAYREIYESGKVITEALNGIKAMQGGDVPYEYIAPPDMWNRRQDTGRSVAEIFADGGIMLVKAQNSRVQGWYDLKEWLHPRENEFGEIKPRLRVFANCTHLIRTLPMLETDKHNPNDVAGEPHEYTHAADALRYWAAGRPVPTPVMPERDEYFPEYDEQVESLLGY